MSIDQDRIAALEVRIAALENRVTTEALIEHGARWLVSLGLAPEFAKGAMGSPELAVAMHAHLEQEAAARRRSAAIPIAEWTRQREA
jgi:hypothetical protein